MATNGMDLLRNWRGDRSQAAAAVALGLDQGRYSQFERGVRRPGLKWALLIQRLTGGSVPAEAWLARGEDEAA